MFRIYVISEIGESAPDYDILNRIKQSVRVITQRGVQYAQRYAPGKRLKRQIDYTLEDDMTGAIGKVWMPEKLKFTLPPGTKKHFIPGGLAVSSYTEAAAIQQAKGYPLSFYWEKRGQWVSPWAVKHPGYDGEPWDVEIIKRLEIVVDKEVEDLSNYIGEKYERK